jgi:hypothetical protein
MKTRFDLFLVVTTIVCAISCSGGGCGGCTTFEPIPGGFPAAKRTPNAGQLRVTQTGLGKVTADPASVIGPLVGGAMNGVVKFPVPPSCSGTTICCPNGQPSQTCGPIDIDLVKRPTDQARMVLTPVSGSSRLDLTIRARVKTEMDLPVTASGVSCDVNLDTTRGTSPDVVITTQISFTQDATAGTTRIAAANTSVTLQDADIQLNGGFTCSIASFFIGVARGQLESQVASTLEDQINSATCKSCMSGDVAECGSSFATACTNGTCMIGNRCLQELGLDGRARGTNLFGGFSPGTTGAIDVYEVTGGYATTNNAGVALGLLGGMQPGGTPRDRCGPPGTAPAPVTIPQSAFFSGNTRPDNGQPYDVGIGLHKSQLDELAYGGYDGGLFCLTVGHSTVSQLTTDTFSLLSRSLGKLVETSAPMALGLRPQSAPTIVLGKNTFMDDGNGNVSLAEPLLDITFKAMEIDFFAQIDEQYIRVFTVVADVHLPVGLQVTGMGELAPVIGDVTDAFTNISVKNNEAITETPEELAALFPQLLGVALPQLTNGLSPIALPALGGLNLSVTDITAVDNNSFLAIYANLVPATMTKQVHTTAQIVSVNEPSLDVARDARRWAQASPPAVTLALGGDAADLEFSYRLDDGTWSPWSTNARPTIAPRTFWLPGTHKIDVRARVKGHPETIDTEPLTLSIPLGEATTQALRTGPLPFHGQSGTTGCGCKTTSGTDAAPLVLIVGLLLLRRRGRARARARAMVRSMVRSLLRLGPLPLLVAIALVPGCSCGSKPCGDKDCMAGEVARGSLGRFTSIASDDQRVLVATYDQTLGDVVVVDATDATNLKYTAVDGIPDDITPTFDPSTYRGGIPDAGPNVGAWTSIALGNHKAHLAYQDRDTKQLRYAREGGRWTSYVVDAGNGEEVGQYASIAVDADGHPAIAYLGIGVDDGMGHKVTELRLARAASATPSNGDWTIKTIVSAPGTCAGKCDTGQACIPGVMEEICVTPSSDCTAACATGEVCSAGACIGELKDPGITDIATGTGIHVSLVVLNDGRLAAAYYDRNRRALVLAVEDSKGASTFTETVLDGNVVGEDRGMWANAVVGGDGTVHIAYQDALRDELLYTTWNGAPGKPEIVDDGVRQGDRTHPVGAAASIYLVGGSPGIAYQDGLTSDVYVATRGSTWTTTTLATGTLLDGFSVAATAGHGTPVVAWGVLDPQQSPPSALAVKSP